MMLQEAKPIARHLGLTLRQVRSGAYRVKAASAQPSTTFRNEKGQTSGTATTDSNGTTTFRGGSGRTTGTATTDSNGTTTFRDASGRTTGTGHDQRQQRNDDNDVP